MLNDQALSQFVPINLVVPEQMPQVLAAAQVHRAPRGTMLFKRARNVSKSFFLLEGEVDLISSDFSVEKVNSGTERSWHSLNRRNPTPASAVAKTSVTYFTIDTALVEKAISQHGAADPNDPLSGEYAIDLGMEVGEVEESQDWMTSILHSPLFSRIPMTQLQGLFARFEKVYVRKGERIVKEGAMGDYFYVLASGEALVSDTSGSIQVRLKPGDYFGEESLISNAPRNASVTMTTHGMLERLNAADFAHLVKEPVIDQLTWKEFNELERPVKILDVRMPIEYRMGHLPQSVNIPLSRIRKSLHELSQDYIYAIASDAGARAEIATYLLCQAGFEAHILRGGAASVPGQASKAS